GGMPPDVLARAFDPFYTTKPPGKGTGLGLSQVYGIAKQCGGDVAIESERNRGTTVTIVLPRAASNAMVSRPGETLLVGAQPHERLLVVDDDPDVREIVVGFLSELGYDVRVATHGGEGLKILTEFQPDAIILDFAMPGMNGAETAVSLRQEAPEIPILFMSGF